MRIVRFYVSFLVPSSSPLLLLSLSPPLVVLLVLLLNCDSQSKEFLGPQTRPSTLSVSCRTSTTTIDAQFSLPDPNHDHPRPEFPAGPQQRLSMLPVPCRTSTTTIPAQCSLMGLNRENPAQCSLPDFNHDTPHPVVLAGPQPRVSLPSVPCRTSTTTIPAQWSLPDLNHDHHAKCLFPSGPQPRVSTPSVPCRKS